MNKPNETIPRPPYTPISVQQNNTVGHSSLRLDIKMTLAKRPTSSVLCPGLKGPPWHLVIGFRLSVCSSVVPLLHIKCNILSLDSHKVTWNLISSWNLSSSKGCSHISAPRHMPRARARWKCRTLIFLPLFGISCRRRHMSFTNTSC